MNEKELPVLKVDRLSKHFLMQKSLFASNHYLKAVEDVSFEIAKGETLGIVGESGCGKSTLGRTIVDIYKPTSGRIFYEGIEISNQSHSKLQPYKKKIQMIFQDPYSSLNPRFTVGDIIEEPMIIHKIYSKTERKERVQALLSTVGLKPDHIRRYPYEFSGGQRQRIVIARTLALNPQFIICDEPISALDVSIQAQIINLLEKIQEERNISYMFIAHDLGMVKHISHKIGVMYLGHMVEYGHVSEIYDNPLHPYTKVLLSAAPIADPIKARAQKRIKVEGDVPSPINRLPGCPFATRCSYCKVECVQQMPPQYVIGTRKVACFLYSDQGHQ